MPKQKLCITCYGRLSKGRSVFCSDICKGLAKHKVFLPPSKPLNKIIKNKRRARF